jgi:type 1 glutamine amidotransferase
MNRYRLFQRSRCLAAAVGAVSLIAFSNCARSTAEPPKGPSEEEVKKIAAAMPEKATAQPAKARKLLIFNRCEGFYHDSIPCGAAAVKMIGEKTGAYTSVISDEMAMFEPAKLNEFDAVVFNNTTALKFENPQHRQALLEFMNNGKGLVGFHGAGDNFYPWPEGAAMMGALFDGHPWGRCPVKIDDPSHPLVKAFGGAGFWIDDEIYKFRTPYSRDKLRVLLSMDAAKGDPNKQGRADGDNAVSWIQQVGKGRAFYASLGHRHDIFWNPTILKFYLDGIQYALGDLPADATPSAKLQPQPSAALPPEKSK